MIAALLVESNFTCQDYAFTMNDQFGEYRFFSNDPKCPTAILKLVSKHFAQLLLEFWCGFDSRKNNQEQATIFLLDWSTG